MNGIIWMQRVQKRLFQGLFATVWTATVSSLIINQMRRIKQAFCLPAQQAAAFQDSR